MYLIDIINTDGEIDIITQIIDSTPIQTASEQLQFFKQQKTKL